MDSHWQEGLNDVIDSVDYKHGLAGWMFNRIIASE